MTLRRLLQEPLVHFLMLGLLLFAAHAVVTPGGGGGDIRVSASAIAAMQEQYRQLWGRPPTPQELDGLIEALIRDEVFYREGVSMGLDRDDAVIKRRVRQKYQLIAEEEESTSPTEEDLTAYLKAHPDRFRQPTVVSFEQVLVPPGADAAVLKTLLANDGDPARLGAATLLPRRVTGEALDQIARDFGGNLAAALAELPLGSWQGPVASGYGVHLVRLSARTPAAAPPLAAVRAQVQREWENDRRQAAVDARYAEARKRYDIRVEGR